MDSVLCKACKARNDFKSIGSTRMIQSCHPHTRASINSICTNTAQSKSYATGCCTRLLKVVKALASFRLAINIECNNTKHGISTLYASGSNARGFPFVDLVGVGTTPNFWGFTPSARAPFFFCRRINWFSLRFASI